MASSSKIKSIKSGHSGSPSSTCNDSDSKCNNVNEVQEHSQTKEDGQIYLDYLTEIVNPKDTPLKLYPSENDIRVLIVPQGEEQRLVILALPNGTDFTVQDIITPLERIFQKKTFHIFLATDPVNKVRYVIKAFPNPNIDKTTNNSSDPKCDHEDPSTKLVPHGTENRYASNTGSGMNGSTNELANSMLKKGAMHLKRNLQILTIYPRPGKESIAINMDDLQCLDEYEYLNDVIIDFYLKYLVKTLFSVDQNRIHLFSQFFFTRLINPRVTSINNSDLSALSKNQHAGVERWTQNVNIFDKDYIIIPIHQSNHWLLVIICYPNLIGVQHNDSSLSELTNPNKCSRILIFESIPEFRSKRHMLVQTLRNYVRCEYEKKFHTECPLSENDLEVVYAEVPKQYNAFDCGLYLLQYAENFLKDYVTSGEEITFPLKSLEHWFEPEVIQKKRDQLKQLIIKLALANNSDLFKIQPME